MLSHTDVHARHCLRHSVKPDDGQGLILTQTKDFWARSGALRTEAGDSAVCPLDQSQEKRKGWKTQWPTRTSWGSKGGPRGSRVAHLLQVSLHLKWLAVPVDKSLSSFCIFLQRNVYDHVLAYLIPCLRANHF